MAVVHQVAALATEDVDERERIIRWVDERSGIRWYRAEPPSARRVQPTWGAVMEDARAGEFRTLVVVSLDRIGTPTARVCKAVAELVDAGVAVVSIDEGVDLRGALGAAARRTFTALAALEQGARAAATGAAGRRGGRPRFVWEPEQLAQVRAWIAQGLSVADIAAEQRLQVATTRGVVRHPSARAIERALEARPA